MISAVIAVLVLIITGYFAGSLGLAALSSLVLVLGMVEYLDIGFLPGHTLPGSIRVVFVGCCVFLFLALSFLSLNEGFTVFGLVTVGYLSAILWTLHRNTPILLIRSLFFSSLVGFLYTGILPAFAIRTLLAANGIKWFVLLLAIVFAGDTAAYFAGLKFGKQKLMPEVSPKKTVAGAIGGLGGSALAACLLGYWFFGLPTLALIVPGSLFAGFFAQSGDLFESLLKRTCGVKDSGKIMPGHGGVLDRLDGIYFAAPVIYLISRWAT